LPAGAFRAGAGSLKNQTKPNPVLIAAAFVILVLWLLGLIASVAAGGFIHILLAISVILMLAHFTAGRGRVG
jgi:hypothetical protein